MARFAIPKFAEFPVDRVLAGGVGGYLLNFAHPQNLAVAEGDRLWIASVFFHKFVMSPRASSIPAKTPSGLFERAAGSLPHPR